VPGGPELFTYSLWNAALKSGAALRWRVRADLILPKLKGLSDGSYLTKIYPSPHVRAAFRNVWLQQRSRVHAGGITVFYFAGHGLSAGWQGTLRSLQSSAS
jgi:hypothetical protein